MTKLEQQIVNHEGLKLTPYIDTRGYLTVGVGYNIGRSVRGIPSKWGWKLTKAQAIEQLKEDISACEIDLYYLFFNWYELSEDRQNVLIDMRFQLGYAGFRTFGRLIEAVLERRYDDVPVEMKNSMWHSQTPNRAKDLIKQWENG